MNNRIKEFELQAYVEVTKFELCHVSGYEVKITTKEFSREKFAELIIKECAIIAMGYENHHGKILDHFGVK